MLWLRKIRLALLVVLVFPCATAQTTRETAAIATALRSGNYAQALDLLRPALQASPVDAQLLTMQGVAFAGIGKPEEALTSFNRALAVAPNDLAALHGAAQIEFDRSSPAAIPLLERLLRLRPQDQIGHGMLAILDFQQENCSKAVEHFEKAGPLFDTKPAGLHAYAICLVRLHRPDQAIPLVQRVLGQNPGDDRERRLLASLQLMAHQPQNALATLSPLLSGAPDSGTFELVSAACEDAHETQKAVDALRQALALDPQDVQLYVDFTALASAHSMFQAGLDVVNEGIRLQPNAAPLYFARGVLFVQLPEPEYDKAQADFETAYGLDPHQTLSVAAQGLLAIQQNDLGHALETIEKKLDNKPNDPVLLYLQADVLVQKGTEPGSAEFQKAMRSAQAAVKLRPELGPARAVLAKLYLQSGAYREAAAECRNALKIDPTDQASLYHLVQALRKSGQSDEIPALLKRLAQLRQDATQTQRRQHRYRLIDPSGSAQ